MKRKRTILPGMLVTLAVACVITGAAVSAARRDRALEPFAATSDASALDCEGNACAQVTLTWDETKQQYKVQNNSGDHWVRVEAANLASSAGICLEPNKTAYLALKSIVGSYRANNVEAGCGATPPTP